MGVHIFLKFRLRVNYGISGTFPESRQTGSRCLLVSKLIIYIYYIICLFLFVIVVVDFLLLFFYTDTEPPLYNPTAPPLYNPNTQSYEVGPPGAFVPPTYTPIQV